MLVERKNLSALRDELAAAGKKIVFTNGCFDILHAGHVRYLTAARSFGDVLIVGLNSDGSVKKLKGDSRPLNGQEDRAEVLLGLKAVDHVVIFDERTAEELVREIRPAVYVKGGDYNPDNLPEGKIVESFGGEVKFVKFLAGRSTTGLINKIAGGR